MRVVWAAGAVTTRDVHQQILRRRDIAYTTVMTIMGILTRKGLLERRLQGRAYLYHPTMTQEELTRSHVAKVIGGLLDRFSGPAMSYLIGKLDTIDEAKLAELEAEVKRLREQRGAHALPFSQTTR
ncbi:MAG: BlaI/MecI/CopY family transcriptional regulator [Chloroflexi bacterium]|nr:BlaI/MecI/CopY family transcriptional regulator [Chloroflexota bacterium]